MSKEKYIFKSNLNSFYYLYQDAEYLLGLAKAHSKEVEKTKLSRTALLLFIMSLEGFINQVIRHFYPVATRNYFMEKKDGIPLEDKWELTPLMITNDTKKGFDKNKYPWTHFQELTMIKNNFANSRQKTPVYYHMMSVNNFEPASYEQIPKELGLSENDITYPHTRIPKDPYSIKVKHAEMVKKIADDMLKELDKLLKNHMDDSIENWARNDVFELIYPPGATMDGILED